MDDGFKQSLKLTEEAVAAQCEEPEEVRAPGSIDQRDGFGLAVMTHWPFPVDEKDDCKRSSEKPQRYARVEEAIVTLRYGDGLLGEFVSAETARQLMRELAAASNRAWHLEAELNGARAVSATGDMESVRVALGCCLALMAQSGNPGCEEMARRIPFTVKNGEPYALVGVDSRAASTTTRL